MTINTSGSNYMSNGTILEWMEMKTERLYGQMRDAMDTSNNRVDAEDALNTVKAKLEELKASGADAGPLRAEIDEIIAKYGNEFPELREALQPISNELGKRMKDNELTRANPANAPQPGMRTMGSDVPGKPPPSTEEEKEEKVEKHAGDVSITSEDPHVKITGEDAERWSKQISDKVDTLGKQDQLGMVVRADGLGGQGCRQHRRSHQLRE
jgi:hypothetical protein